MPLPNLVKAAKNLRSYIDPNQVGFLILYLTNRCNFRCPFCFYLTEVEQGAKPDELTVEELTTISEKIGPLIQLSMTGGEPFLRKELFEIAHVFVKNTGARYITIPTNASLTDRMVAFLEEFLPAHRDTYLRLTFSIEGISERHDKIRGVPGSYKNIQKSYDAISPMRTRHPNLVLDVNSVYTAESENTLLDTVTTLSEDFDFDNICITFARGEIKDPALKKVSRENYERINTFLEELRRGKESRLLYPLWRGVRDVSRENLIRTVFNDEFVTPCVAGRKLLILGETGEVYPCEILDRGMGNIRDYDYDIKALVAEQANRELQDWIVTSKCKCSFECALASNVIWNKSSYPHLIKSAIRNIGSSSPNASVR